MKCISHDAYVKIIAVIYEDKNNMWKGIKQILLSYTISVFNIEEGINSEETG